MLIQVDVPRKRLLIKELGSQGGDGVAKGIQFRDNGEDEDRQAVCL